MGTPNLPHPPKTPERKTYSLTALFRQFRTPEDLARIAGYMGALPHPDGARLAGELCGRADIHTAE